MIIHHIRNATFIIETKEFKLLIDPMLGKKGSIPTFTFFRYKAKRNPTVDLPDNIKQALKGITHCLITHCRKGHLDHLDKDGIQFLRNTGIPVICHITDKKHLENKGINVLKCLGFWKTFKLPEGKMEISTIPALHGRGWITAFMANGLGYFIKFENEPSIYISGDTVLTEDVRKAMKSFRPDITVVASGMARLDLGKHILMQLDEIVQFVKMSPEKVICNHMEALNHCPLTRSELKEQLINSGVNEKIWIPKDGETLEFY
ncbi:MBL fold metallo-hydrolase [Tamlana flava]|uniref:MBL fold metallo-hydrolase n=1 Tax=Tamlana flava TaxID=3158572 RepID=UPI00351ABBC9